MDVFTDVDIFMGIIGAAQRGVAVYILLDESQVNSFLHMAHNLGVNVQDTKVKRTYEQNSIGWR